MDKFTCPKCGKTLIRLEPFMTGCYDFWCDDCDLEISIADNRANSDVKEND